MTRPRTIPLQCQFISHLTRPRTIPLQCQFISHLTRPRTIPLQCQFISHLYDSTQNNPHGASRNQTLDLPLPIHHLVGLVVRRPPRERKVPVSNPARGGIFSGSSHTSDLNIGTPVATLPGALRYRVSAGTGRPGVSIM